MQRTLKRYQIAYNPPTQHPRKTVNALRLIYHVSAQDRPALSKALFKAYWVEGKDVSNSVDLLEVANNSGITSAGTLTEAAFKDEYSRKALEDATADAISRGAFGVPGFWIPGATWKDFNGEMRRGRFYWGQDRMHFVEASILSLRNNTEWSSVPELHNLMPRCIEPKKLIRNVRLEFWYDFSSPWAFLGWAQLNRIQRTFGSRLEIIMKPFLLGILFREIGAPNLPMSAVSTQKALWSRQDHSDWVRFWNAVNAQEGGLDKEIRFHWADIFPIRTPTVLRCAHVDPSCVPLLCQ